MSIKDITVVITTFKSSEKIKDCINSIDSQLKILLIENSNDIDFKKEIERNFNNVECILTGSNLGYGSANNIGLKKVKTKYTLILNPDTILHKEALNYFLSAAEQKPNFVIMGPYIQDENKNTNESFKKSAPIEVFNIKGFAMFINMKEIKDVGFFDENIFFYFEEIDLCRRAINKGKKIYIVPGLRIIHSGGQSHEKYINMEMEFSRNWHWMWSTFYYHKKYHGFFISFLIILPKLSSAIIKTIIYSITFNKKKKIYYQRLSGLINSIIGKSSWYRPNV